MTAMTVTVMTATSRGRRVAWPANRRRLNRAQKPVASAEAEP